MSSNDPVLTNRDEAFSFRDARNRRDAEAAPLSTGETPGDEIESFDFNHATGVPVRNPVFYVKEQSPAIIAAPIECKFAGDGIAEGLISGYGSVFGVTDSYGDVVDRGAFADTITEHRGAKSGPMMLWSHDPTRPIGVWDKFEEDGRGLKVTGRLNLDTQDGREAHALVKQGALSGLSIGYAVKPGGAKLDKGGIRRLTSVDLWEVSIVAFPANRQSRIIGVKALDSSRDFEAFLHEHGLSKAAAKKLAFGGWSALSSSDPAIGDLAAEIKKAILQLRGK